MSAKSDRQDLIKLFQRYNVRLGMLYGKFVKELSKLGVSVEDKLQDEPLFMFDHFPELTTRLSDIISDYKADYVNLYKQGISSGVALAFGQDAKNLHGYTIYNDDAINRVRTAAINAFTKKRMSPSFGLSLSQKIWNYLQQTKSEFEVAMSNVITDGLKKGTSAAELSKQVRQQLINPDMMYRRYHHKVITAGGNEKDVVKWHKRVIDGSGKVRFVEAPLEQVGRGVYRSSYKNSFRLMRTEINMSYHYANNERWKAEPFVIGMRISLSPEHPREDMCDELAGDYPKDFNWASWHPQCLCMSSAILCSKEELKEIAKRTAKGEDMSQYKSPNLITECPENFNQYIDKMHDKIIAAAERGTLGYYLRDNKKYWTGRFSAEERQQMGISEVSSTSNAKQIAQMRHAKRTSEYIADIYRRWDERKADNIFEIYKVAFKYNNNIEAPDFVRRANSAIYEGKSRSEYIEDLRKAEKWAAIINKANIRHEARTAAQAEAIQKRWDERRQYSVNMPTELRAGSQYLKGENYVFDKNFFNLIDKSKPIKLRIDANDEGSFSSFAGDFVHLCDGNRNSASSWERKSVVYHEYGHCIDAQRELWLDAKLIELRNKQIEWLLGKCDKQIMLRYWSDDTSLGRWGGWAHKRLTFENNAAYIDRRLCLLKEKIDNMYNSTFTKYGITKQDVLEQILATRDALKSLVVDYGTGHTTEYFSQTRMKETEYLAHAFENAFIGNRVFQKVMPEIYDEMITYIKELKPII